MKKKAFTLIELIAVLVILAILALIVTPLVMNIIRKARISADKRSIDSYGRSVELAIAEYLLDNGDFPKSIDQLSIEYSGDRVECERAQLNQDSSVYLAGCRVAGRNVDGYTYGSEETIVYEAYEVGDEVTYHGVDYYVVKNSGISESSVTLIKATPLTVDEVAAYGVGHINKYIVANHETVGNYQNKGYGGMAYYSSDTCGYVVDRVVTTGCTSNYADSDIKYVVDAWALANTTASDLVVDSTGYSARLLTYEELTTSLGYTPSAQGVTYMNLNSETVPSWVYNSDYYYWTMSPYQDGDIRVWHVDNNGYAVAFEIYYDSGEYTVRPVITISKSAI